MNPDLAAQALHAFSETRAMMVSFKVPNVEKSAILFFASLAMQLEPAVDWSCQTASTDGRRIFINPEFYLGLPLTLRFGLHAHEAYHVALSHHARREGRDLKLWNIACDLAINPILSQSGFRLPTGVVYPGVGSYAGMPVGLSAEDYYALLVRPPEQEQQQQGQSDQQNQSEEEDDGADEAPHEPDERQEPAEGEEGDGEEEGGDHRRDEQGGDRAEQEEGQGGEGEGEGGDDEGEAEGGGEGEAEGQAQGQAQGGRPDPGNCGGVIDPGQGMPDECKAEEGKWQVAVAQAAQAAKQMGAMPAWLERLVEVALAPNEDWRQILREFLSRWAKSDHSWSRPNRRFLQQGVHLPSLHSEELGDVIITVDCSGSIGQHELDIFASEVQGILDCFDCTLTVLYHDIPVTHVQHWTPCDGPLKLQPRGGGGTSHVPVFDWIERNADDNTPCVVCFTDLYTTFPDRAPRLPVLWAVYGDEAMGYSRPATPFGRVCAVKG